MGDVSQVRVAERMGVDESRISRMKGDEIERIALLLAACGLKAVPEHHEVYDAGYLRALRSLLATELQKPVPSSGFGEL